MIKLLSYLLLACIFLGCGEDDLVETHKIEIKGKPVNFVHIFHLKRGSLWWSYKGEIKGKVKICIAGCQIVVENNFTQVCDKTDVLSGKFDVKSIYGGEEGVSKGRQLCFVFVPEAGTNGVVNITFRETVIGGW